MVIVKFIQDGLKCHLEGETDTYKYSKNMEMQFVKDEEHQDYEVTVFFLDQEKNEGKIDIDENGVFKIGERFFLRKDPFYLSFQLKKGDEIQHLGNYKMRVCDAIGNGSSPLPEDPKIWIEYVDEEMDKYFNENFQPKLDKFNADYEEIKKIAASGGSGSSITVDSELNSTSKNPVQNKVIKAELDKKAAKNEIPTNLSSLNEDETHQTVTAEEKKKWDGKSDFDGDFNSLNNIPNIPDAVIVDAELNETSTNAIQNQAVTKELAEKLSKNGLKTINGQSLVGSGNIELSAGDNDYELPIANNETLGGVKPVAKTDEMTQEVGVDEAGGLFTKEGDGIDEETLNQINRNTEDISKLSDEIANLTVGNFNDYDLTVKSINHRGYNTVAPENTIPAYILSKQKGFKYVECDVAFTSDNVCVLLHDDTIDRTSNGSGSISSLTYEQVLQYDFGSWKSSTYAGTKIPTLEEFLMYCKGLGLHPYIEIKDGSYTQEQINSVVDTVEKVGMKGKVTYISFNITFLGYVKQHDNKARLGYVVSGVSQTNINNALSLKTDDNEVFIDAGGYNDSSIELCLNNDIPLEVWTYNGTSQIQNMNAYITGVTSDSLIAGKILHDKYMTYTPPIVEDDETGGEDTPTEATLTNIEATYSGGDVEEGTSLNDLTGIIVTGTYSDGTTKNIIDYTLSGVINEGTNTITVSYQGQTTTFTVNGVASVDETTYSVVRTITSDELGKCGCSPIYAPSNMSPTCGNYTVNNLARISYWKHDIPVEVGYTYKFEYETALTGSKIGLQFYDQTALDNVASSTNYSDDNCYDPGWQDNGVEITITEGLTKVGTTPVGVKLTFKNANNNNTIETSDIAKVIISRKKV